VSKITFRADDELVERIEAHDASKSEVMRAALRAYLGEERDETTRQESTTVSDDEPGAVEGSVVTLDDAVLDRLATLVEDRMTADGRRDPQPSRGRPADGRRDRRPSDSQRAGDRRPPERGWRENRQVGRSENWSRERVRRPHDEQPRVVVNVDGQSREPAREQSREPARERDRLDGRDGTHEPRQRPSSADQRVSDSASGRQHSEVSDNPPRQSRSEVSDDKPRQPRSDTSDSRERGVSDGDRRGDRHDSDRRGDRHQSESQPSDETCSRCGATVSDDHVYCPNCGQKAAHRLFCDCGDEVRSDWSFCPSCGRRTPAADVLDRGTETPPDATDGPSDDPPNR
jgi:Arc/MetJ-type ribon-helix-helix transcriptional regulator/RNA polymerase subunit RPABC4/transcription elongation factor Spt4